MSVEAFLGHDLYEAITSLVTIAGAVLLIYSILYAMGKCLGLWDKAHHLRMLENFIETQEDEISELERKVRMLEREKNEQSDRERKDEATSESQS